MQLFTIVNRSSKTLEGVWDGKHYDLLPGKKYAFPEIQALKFREQNPVMGSEDQRTGQKEYLIGIEELKDDCSPIEQSDSIELAQRLDPSEIKVVRGKGGLYAEERHATLPVDGIVKTAFVKP